MTDRSFCYLKKSSSDFITAWISMSLSASFLLFPLIWNRATLRDYSIWQYSSSFRSSLKGITKHVPNPNLGHSYLLKPIEHDLIRVISNAEQAERKTDKVVNVDGFSQLLSHTVTQIKVLWRVSQRCSFPISPETWGDPGQGSTIHPLCD